MQSIVHLDTGPWVLFLLHALHRLPISALACNR
ncbi:hypothetical protein CGRA01v4_07509 [Colletotrichum graminicola]|nr:hypothetical protein CGRA01v4_07509 [Colletotrichum graminicola]